MSEDLGSGKMSGRDIEDVLRESLRQHAAQAPDGRLLAERIAATAGRTSRAPRTRSRRLSHPRLRHDWRAWALPLVSAGAVAAIAAAVVGINDAHHAAATRSIQPGDSTSASPSSAPSSSSSVSPVQQGYSVADLTYVGPNDGWALTNGCTGSTGCAGDPHRILHSTDGSNWTDVSASPLFGVENLRFASDSTGYAFGPTALFMTTDGAKTWHKQAGGAVALETLDGNVIRVVPTQPGCSPPGCAYEVETAKIGSSNWTTVPLPAPQTESTGVVLSRTGSSAYLLVLGHPAGGAQHAESTLYYSHNDGATWAERGEPCMSSVGSPGGSEIDSTALTTAADGTAFAACEPRDQTSSSGAYVATSTSDGDFNGAKSTARLGDIPISQLAAADAKNFCAESDALYCTHDGGQTWEKANGPTNVTWLGFETSRDGRALGTSGGASLLWTTHDAGKTWSSYSFSPSAPTPANSATTAATSAASAPCTDLQIDPLPSGAAAGTAGFRILFTNKGNSACTLQGYPTVDGVDPAVQASQSLDAMLGGVTSGTTPPKLVLEPGQTVSAAVQWSDVTSQKCKTPAMTTSSTISVAGAGSVRGPAVGTCVLEVHPFVGGTTGEAGPNDPPVTIAACQNLQVTPIYTKGNSVDPSTGKLELTFGNMGQQACWVAGGSLSFRAYDANGNELPVDQRSSTGQTFLLPSGYTGSAWLYWDQPCSSSTSSITYSLSGQQSSPIQLAVPSCNLASSVMTDSY